MLMFPPLHVADLCCLPACSHQPACARTDSEQTIQVRLDWLEQQGIRARTLLSPPQTELRDTLLKQFTPAQFNQLMQWYCKAFEDYLAHTAEENMPFLRPYHELLLILHDSPYTLQLLPLWGSQLEAIRCLTQEDSFHFLNTPHPSIRDALLCSLACLAWPTVFSCVEPPWHIFGATGCFGEAQT